MLIRDWLRPPRHLLVLFLGTTERRPFRTVQRRAALLTILLVPSCAGLDTGQAPLTAEVPLHLEDHLDVATIAGSEVPEDIPEPVEWRFDEPQPEWKPATPFNPDVKPVRITRADNGLRLVLTEANGFTMLNGRRALGGSIYVDLPEWKREDWAYVAVRARTSEPIGTLAVGFNLLREGPAPTIWQQQFPFEFDGEYVDVVSDGSVQTYLLRADWSEGGWENPWDQLGIVVEAEEPASIDILSVAVIPKGANYADAPVGVGTEVRNDAYRRTLYTHAPGRLEYRVHVPEGGRLNFGLEP